jgi:hypothetical protein
MTSKSTMTSQQRVILGCLASVATMVGAIGPWRTLGIIKVSGTDLTSDATVILVLAVVAVVLIVLDKSATVVVMIGLLVTYLGIFNIDAVTSPVIFGVHPSVGWGLIVDIMGGLGLLAHGIVDLHDMRMGRRAIAEAARTTPA